MRQVTNTKTYSLLIENFYNSPLLALSLSVQKTKAGKTGAAVSCSILFSSSSVLGLQDGTEKGLFTVPQRVLELFPSGLQWAQRVYQDFFMVDINSPWSQSFSSLGLLIGTLKASHPFLRHCWRIGSKAEAGFYHSLQLVLQLVCLLSF